MKITICGSIAFYREMLEVKKQLEALDHEVKIPPTEIRNEDGKMIPVEEYYRIRKKENYKDDWVWDQKEKSIREHFTKVSWADVILVTNYNKKGIKDYIGANTLIEIGVAFFLNKKIYLYNGIPEMDYKEEIVGMKPIVINRNLKEIK